MNFNHFQMKRNEKRVKKELRKFREELTDHPNIEMRNFVKHTDLLTKKRKAEIKEKPHHLVIEQRIPNLEKNENKRKSEKTLVLEKKIKQAKVLRDHLVHVLYREELAERSKEYRLHRKDRIPGFYKHINPKIYEKNIYPSKIQNRLDEKERLESKQKEEDDRSLGILQKLI
jgi:hypothetical protein